MTHATIHTVTGHPSLIPSIIAAISSVIAAGIGAINRRHIKSVHVLVNGRLDQAMRDIAVLKQVISTQKDELDRKNED